MGRDTQRGLETLARPEAADESMEQRPAEGTELNQKVLPSDISDQPVCIRRRRGEELRLSLAEYRVKHLEAYLDAGTVEEGDR